MYIGARIYFSPDGAGGGGDGFAGSSDNGTSPVSSPSIGQTENTPAPANAGQTDNAPFLEMADEKGSKRSWKTRDEFLKDAKDMMLMRSDYSRKTAAAAAERQEWERQKAEWERQKQEQSSKFEKYNKFLASRPDVYKQLEAAMKQGLPADAALDGARQYADEKYNDLLNQLKELKDKDTAREQAESKRKLFDSFHAKYEDFNEDSVNDLLRVLGEGDSEAIVDLLYYAGKGKGINPLEVEKKIVDKIQDKGKARILPGNGAKPAATKGYKSLDEAYKAAIAGVHG